jgi:hypothetical protein
MKSTSKKQADEGYVEVRLGIATAVLQGLCTNPDISMDMGRRRITSENARQVLAESAWKTAGCLIFHYKISKEAARRGATRARKG